MAHPREILDSLGANPRKSLSQNFLTSPHWADRLTDAVVKSSASEIWEIGPGLGALTRPLLQKAKVPVTLFEYDKKYAEYLRKEFPMATIVEGDFLEADLTSRLKGDTKISILSNLPYHLSSPILYRLVEIKSSLVTLVMTFQKEFADRLIARPRTSAYGALSVVSQLHFKIDTLGTLPPKAFYPAPEVASEALVFEPKESPPDIELIEKIVQTAFLHRRKKMMGNLKRAFENAPWEKIFERAGISANARAEELTQEDFLSLAKNYSQV